MPATDPTPTPAPTSAFATTRWTMLLRAGTDDVTGRRALADLCRAYWLPLYVYVRRRGNSPHDAEDLTQSFFADLLSRGALKRADPARGRFRNFLLTALTNFLHNARDHDRAARRGGAAEHLSIDAESAAGLLDQIETDALTPDRAFDRGWALAIFERALRRLRAEQEKLGRERWFDRLRPLLQAGPKPGDYDAIAAEFDVTKNVVAVAVHRMSGRYREFVRAEIAETVSNPEELEDELRELLANLSS